MSETVVTLDTRVRPGEGVLFQRLKDEAILLNLNSGVYFGLDEVGTEVWALMPEFDSVRNLARVIADRYSVSMEQCQRDLLDLMQQMLEQGLVTAGEI
jgi:hypothetical protein